MGTDHPPAGLGFYGGRETPASTGTGSTPIDLAISNDSRYLYALAPGTGIIDGFGIGSNGSLTLGTTAKGLPASASGLVVR